jgi:hypothetical protein
MSRGTCARTHKKRPRPSGEGEPGPGWWDYVRRRSSRASAPRSKTRPCAKAKRANIYATASTCSSACNVLSIDALYVSGSCVDSAVR